MTMRLRTKGSFASVGVASCLLIASACRERAPVHVPGPTTARPDAERAVLSGPVTDPKASHAVAEAPPAVPSVVDGGAAPSAGLSGAARPDVRFVKPGTKIDADVCTQVAIVAARGAASVDAEPGTGQAPKRIELAKNDLALVTHGHAVTPRGPSEVVAIVQPVPACAVDETPPMTAEIVRGNVARELRWAKGTMRARLDLDRKVSPHLYLGRLEGTAPVPEHVHDGAYEILVALEGSGTFTLDGVAERLTAPKIVVVPPNVKHAWKPDPGSKLVAVQGYTPPGPEQRFLALDAAERDGGAPR